MQRTVGVVLARDLEDRRKCLRILVDCRADLVRYMLVDKEDGDVPALLRVCLESLLDI